MKKYPRINASPVKRFFVEMLTRDILVEDAILDLLDNCVDGILRTHAKDASARPYEKFWARITVSTDRFVIEDNCGGIPWSEHDRAFRMGRSDSDKQISVNSVGVYGIGMKRAIFKIGTDAQIWTQHEKDNYEVPITANWMKDEDEWSLPVTSMLQNMMTEDGTKITIHHLHKGIRDRFASPSFQNELIQKIANHYAVIIKKGFKVEVNGIFVEPKPILIRFTPNEKKETEVIRPYVFKSKVDGVDVFLAVGLREPIPGIEEVRFSSEFAGWTIIANDRVVLYCDKSELTGWGTAGIPQYHTQFIAISGVVEFSGDPRKLPTTTTKRGLEYSSSLYLQVLERMREGMHLFTDFTNKWKMREDEAKVLVAPIPPLPYSELKEQSQELSFTKTRTGLDGEFYKPRLPLPPANTTDMRISYVRERDVILDLAEEILPDFDSLSEREVPKKVGEMTFDLAYKRFLEKKSK